MVIQGVFLFAFGPYLASWFTPNLMEQASIWCFFSIAQIAIMLFFIRETLIINWGRDGTHQSLVTSGKGSMKAENGNGKETNGHSNGKEKNGNGKETNGHSNGKGKNGNGKETNGHSNGKETNGHGKKKS